ncbi:MAG: divergent polysaccharide deacetylase family protein [Fibrobacter sp.]|jgi:polysaccharide deacetylase 2 family uncharacterized protein YibQ|nr:divergent polysaccharide deacetylase family protein [Fibrobacter sp.]
MKNLRHLIILLFVVGIFIGLGLSLPRLMNHQTNAPEITENLSSAEAEIDTTPYLQKLTEEIPVIKIHPARKNRKEIWMLGKGISLPNYLLRAQNHLNKFQGKVLRMEEIFPNREAQAAAFDFLTPEGDTMQVELHISDSFLDSASKIAILFQADSLNIPLLSRLETLDYPYALLITPFDTGKTLFSDLDRLQNKELVAWLPMESHSLQANRFSNKTISIHHTEQDIKETIQQAHAKMPSAIGAATRMGERAVEHPQLLNAVFKALRSERWWFMDLTESRTSKVNETCQNFSFRCPEASIYNTQKTLDQFIDGELRTASRTGSVILVLPLHEKSLNALADIKTKASARGTEIVKLSNIITYE